MKMTVARKRRLFFIAFLLLGVGTIVSLVLYVLKQNIDLYRSPSQVHAQPLSINARFRLGGWVQKNSVVYAPEGLRVQFIVTDHQQQLLVLYQGVLPALFREGQSVVAEGTLNAKGEFIATQVLAKHDENYHPPLTPAGTSSGAGAAHVA